MGFQTIWDEAFSTGELLEMSGATAIAFAYAAWGNCMMPSDTPIPEKFGDVMAQLHIRHPHTEAIIPSDKRTAAEATKLAKSLMEADEIINA